MLPGNCVYTVAKAPGQQPSESPEGEGRKRLDLRLDPELRERIESQASRFKGGLSGYIRQAIIERLERDEATDPNRES